MDWTLEVAMCLNRNYVCLCIFLLVEERLTVEHDDCILTHALLASLL